MTFDSRSRLFSHSYGKSPMSDLPHHDAEREQIGARIDARRIEILLGADVERRAEHLILLRQRERVVGLREAEVEQLDLLARLATARDRCSRS